ncbi:hypothetical protein T09_8500 [Trichinella sp. T9]|nr:hypothetical protein T09_8500 [Trichinella sp. T9]
MYCEVLIASSSRPNKNVSNMYSSCTRKKGKHYNNYSKRTPNFDGGTQRARHCWSDGNVLLLLTTCLQPKRQYVEIKTIRKNFTPVNGEQMETCLNRLHEYNSFDLRLTSFETFLFGRLLLAINTSQYIFEAGGVAPGVA